MAKGVSVVIQATDRASATIEGINKRLRGIAAPGERFSKALGKLADTSGLTAAARGVSTLARSTAAAAESLGRFAPALGALTGLGTIAGLASLSGRFAEFGTRLGLDARRIGTTADRLHGLQGAARLAGASAEDLTGGMRALGDTLFNATSGRAPEAAVLFSQLGVAFRDSRTGAARLAEDVLPELATRIAAIKNPTLQAQIATELFGGAGEALLPFLRKGAAGMAEYRREAERYGVMNQRGVDAANDLRMAQTRLGLAVEGVGYAVAERLAPVLVPALTRLSDWVASHREDISAFFERVAKGLVSWVEGGGIERTIGSLEDFGRKINDVVQLFGGWERAAIGLGVVLAASVLAPLAQIATKLGYFAAWQAPKWLLTFLTGRFGPAAALAFVGAGSDEGNADVQRQANERYTEQRARENGWWQRNMPSWLGGGGLDTGSGHAGMTPGEAARAGRAQSSPTTRTFDTTMSPHARALLDTIAGTESPGYNVLYGGRRFADMSHHPNVPVPIERGPNAGLTSTAAGRYQFLNGTWNEAAARTGLRDFGPASQDRNAWWLAQRDYNRRTGRDLNGDLQSNDPAVRAGVGPALRGTWTSLPGGIEAGTTTSRFQAQLDAGIDRYRREALPNGVPTGSVAPPVQAPPAPLPPSPAGTPGANGTADLRVSFANPPPGMSHSVTTSGDVTMGGIGLSRPMVGMGTLP